MYGDESVYIKFKTWYYILQSQHQILTVLQSITESLDIPKKSSVQKYTFLDNLKFLLKNVFGRGLSGCLIEKRLYSIDFRISHFMCGFDSRFLQEGVRFPWMYITLQSQLTLLLFTNTYGWLLSWVNLTQYFRQLNTMNSSLVIQLPPLMKWTDNRHASAENPFPNHGKQSSWHSRHILH